MAAVDFPASEQQLQAIRARGDLNAERAHLWQLLAMLTKPPARSDVPIFLTWYGTREVFDRSQPSPRRDLLTALSIAVRNQQPSHESAGAPRITRVHYNPAAFGHIRSQGLFTKQGLARNADTVPAFPRDAMVVKTVWWPVPAEGVVALPVWDSAGRAAGAGANDYPTWPRVVGVSSQPGLSGNAAVEFMGRRFAGSHLVSLGAFVHFNLTAQLADSLMSDPESRKLALIVLGRPLKAGDALALVAMHLATREIADWVWGTFWWHDAAGDGPYSAGRPDLPQPWQNYLMNVSFDRELPREADGSPHVAYNPWLEARFADTGHGAGVVSNCMTCHARASSAVDRPFMVTRGNAASTSALAQPGAPVAPVSTSFLWSIPMQAR